MANVTLAIDDDLLHRARVRALEQGTSVNAVVRAYLEAYAGAGEARSRALRSLLAASRSSRSGRGRARWTRESLHDR